MTWNIKLSPEDSLQATCVQWFRIKYPNKMIFAIPNGGKRHMTTAIRLKKTGALAGVFDLFVPVAKHGFNGLFLEAKYGENKLTEEQRIFKSRVEKEGYLAKVFWKFEEFEGIVNEFLK